MDSLPISEGLRALKAVQAVFPGALLAGGYLRDAVFKRQPKDIDIFVPFMDTVPTDTVPKLYPEAGAADYIEQGEVSGIFNVYGFDLPVQVIALKQGLDPVDRAKAHDLSFCQVWHDGVELGMTKSFMSTYANGVVTLDTCEDKAEFDRSMRRWARLSLKYPEMILSVPERFRQYEANSDFDFV